MFDSVEDFVRARVDAYVNDPDITFQSLSDEWNSLNVGKRAGRKKIASLFASIGVSPADKKVRKIVKKGSMEKLGSSADPRAVLLREQWSSENGEIPASLSVGSSKKFLWVCELGHSWLASVHNRWKGSGCHYCSGRLVLKGFNDFASRYPELVDEWDSSNVLKPDEVSHCAGKMVRWVCKNGHKWEIKVSARANGSPCPYCSKIYASSEHNLRKSYPLLAKLWDYEKNPLLPSEVLPKSSNFAWWTCDAGHSYKMRISGKTTGDPDGRNCPVCNHKTLLSGYNDFASLHPELVKFWRDSRSPDSFAPSSLEVVSWECSVGHEFDMQVKTFVRSNGGCPVCSGRRVVAGVNDLPTVAPELLDFWDEENNARSPESLTAMSGYRASWKCDSGHEWQTSVRDRYYYKTQCPKCSLAGFSHLEKELAEFVESLNVGEIVENDRTVLNGRELDVFVPEKMIAFEFNGLYWHSENAGKDRNYHYNKFMDCKNAGVQLFQIWEDDWVNKRETVERLIASKLGASSQPRIFARKTVPSVVEFGEAKKFLNAYHVQGSTVCRAFGLRDDNNELVAVLGVVDRGDDTVEVVRYATSRIVVGGFTKLLKFMVSSLNVGRVVSFSDNEVSDGGLYESNGFTVDGFVRPDYKYVVNGVREHKFNYRIQRFKNDPTLVFVDGLTESQLASLNGLDRVWDSGKVRWVRVFD